MLEYFIKKTFVPLIQIVSFCFLALLYFSCGYPVNPDDRDILELERIWQYCRVYSIYSDRVPTEKKALQFNDPFSLVDSLQDTMYSYTTREKSTIGRYYSNYEDLLYEIYGGMNNSDAKQSQAREDSLYYTKITDSTLYIRIPCFDTLIYNEFINIDSSIAKAPNIILDLKDNGGGLIKTCRSLTELFLPVNVPYLFVEYRRDILKSKEQGPETISDIWKADSTSINQWKGKKVVILINNGTASAAEIMTVALKDAMDSNSVFVIGEKSYGKGVGQYTFLFDRTSGAALKLTGFHFYRIVGEDYHESGIEPDSIITNTIDQIIFAGIWLEPNFNKLKDNIAFEKVITYNINNAINKKSRPHNGCFKVISSETLLDL